MEFDRALVQLMVGEINVINEVCLSIMFTPACCRRMPTSRPLF
jgi:hypothetical protein